MSLGELPLSGAHFHCKTLQFGLEATFYSPLETL